MISFELFSDLGFSISFHFQNGNDTTTQRRMKVDSEEEEENSTTKEKATPQQRMMGQQKQHRPKEEREAAAPHQKEEGRDHHSALLCLTFPAFFGVVLRFSSCVVLRFSSNQKHSDFLSSEFQHFQLQNPIRNSTPF